METKLKNLEPRIKGGSAATTRACTPFPKREIVRPGPRGQGSGFASLRALDCSGPSLGDSLFMRERGGTCNGEDPPGRGCTTDGLRNATLRRIQARRFRPYTETRVGKFPAKHRSSSIPMPYPERADFSVVPKHQGDNAPTRTGPGTRYSVWQVRAAVLSSG